MEDKQEGGVEGTIAVPNYGNITWTKTSDLSCNYVIIRICPDPQEGYYFYGWYETCQSAQDQINTYAVDGIDGPFEVGAFSSN
jgi:hypothetical protein